MVQKAITSANSVLLLGVTSLFPTAQQMQNFATDDMYSMDPVDNAEVVMGADGVMSAGWIPQIKVMHITLMPNSNAMSFFESWFAQEEALREVLYGFGTLNQPSIGRTYALTNGVLSQFAPIADGKKVLQARRFQIKWESALGAPI